MHIVPAGDSLRLDFWTLVPNLGFLSLILSQQPSNLVQLAQTNCPRTVPHTLETHFSYLTYLVWFAHDCCSSTVGFALHVYDETDLGKD